MFGKKHTPLSRQWISEKMSKHLEGVSIYDLNDNVVSKNIKNVELAKHLNI